jgi:hypothetical protein
MPITSNVAWDGRLELFRGRDSTQYVRAAASRATACSTCGLPLTADEQLSMSVDVSVGTGPDGNNYRAFDCCVCHRACCVPDLTVHEGSVVPENLTSSGAVMVLHYKDESGNRRFPALVFTLLPNLTFGVPGAEFSSVLVSVLLGQGFQLVPRAGWDFILGQAASVGPETFCTLTPQGLLVLHVAGQDMYTHQLDRSKPDGAAWLEAAAGSGTALVLGGDNLVITRHGVDLAPVAAEGTLVAGLVALRK